MSNEIEAPEIEGFELCVYDEWSVAPEVDSAQVTISAIDYYYKRIKPREETLKEAFKEILRNHGWYDSIVISAFEDMADYIEANYVRKEG